MKHGEDMRLIIPRVGLQQSLLRQSAWSEAWGKLGMALRSGALAGGEAKFQGKDELRSDPNSPDASHK